MAKKKIKVKVFHSLRESLQDALAFERSEMDGEKRGAIRGQREEIAQSRHTRIARMRRQAVAGE